MCEKGETGHPGSPVSNGALQRVLQWNLKKVGHNVLNKEQIEHWMFHSWRSEYLNHHIIFAFIQGNQGEQGSVGATGPKGSHVSACCLDYPLILTKKNVFILCPFNGFPCLGSVTVGRTWYKWPTRNGRPWGEPHRFFFFFVCVY